ncbi:MAG: DUF3422 domain-containing protein [Hyphomicrobiales bacterium]|nr:DUF3422 domain-containing protein [Hyphomicrobiales bacterium]
MHARPFAPLTTPHRVLHYAFMPEGEARVIDRRNLRALCESRGLPGPASGAKHHRVDLGDFVLLWEGHTEFTTYSFEIPAAAGVEPFAPPAEGWRDPMSLVPAPGPLLAKVDLCLVSAPADAPAPAAFAGRDVARSSVERGRATIASDFAPDDRGFVRIALLDHGLGAAKAGALARRALEIETYRVLCLLGLPAAQEMAPAIRGVELALPALIDGMRREGTMEDNRALLDRLIAHAAELERAASANAFRFGATRAYHKLIESRLAATGERPAEGAVGWGEFFARRLQPAVRTCNAVQRRADELSRRLARAAQLLRTRVEIDLETQNAGVLRAMNDLARLQLRLQRTVEGLSVAAISYYVASLAGHVFDGLHAAGYPVDPAVATALAVPVAVLAVGVVVWRIRSRHGE